ncbi:PKD repeat protein [Arcticibacter tournemirensis]|uniref:PKD domain-containing protein n=1 Tax=Arcticibacter tournemirensis TaxID=699437 RepID=A0A5M9HLR0_9SPHI|nr:PKD domain-containing protein [Arcticibacter tournemirensis]KAA8485937.1 PKD domain-containing protein [Arcticibacter tournemirensis]TQM46804.1 PKD repeat protein [Arcticibacter tournemirensis]
MRRFVAVLLVFFTFYLGLCVDCKAQIAFGTIDPGPYGPGSNITVPLTVSGFKAGNRFELWMYDSGGNLVSYSPIGTFDGHYTTFINGVIPETTMPGNGYMIRVKSSNPEVMVDYTGIKITDKPGPKIKISPLEEKNLLKTDLIYGFCQNIQDGNVLTLADSSASAVTVTGLLFDDYDKLKSPESFTVSPDGLLDIILGKSYYTARLRSELNGVVSTKSYVILNVDFTLNLQASGSQIVCLKYPIDPNNESEKLGYSVIIDSEKGIAKNYPGLLYNFDWGDDVIEHFTKEDLIARGGVVKHHYNESSCSEPPVMIYPPVYNSYTANISISAGFCIGAAPQFTSYPKVYLLPKADFVVPSVGGCVTKDVTFINTTIPGMSPNSSGTGCTDLTTYKWYIKKSTETSWHIKSAAQNFTFQFPEVGTYNIKLVASNNSCSPTEIIKDICISELPVPDFEFTQSSACNSALITTVNHTNVANLCSKHYLWQVIDSLSGVAVSDGITFLDKDTSDAPRINVAKPGSYILRLTVTNSCSDVVLDKPFMIAGGLAVTQPVEAKICKGIPVVIDFATEERVMPMYEGFGRNKTYQWTVTGGSYEFIGGSDKDPFPVIKFNEVGKKYTVSLVYNNECGPAVSSSQDVTLYALVNPDAGSDGVLCDYTPMNKKYVLSATTPNVLNGESGKWTVVSGPSGSLFDDSTKPNATISNLLVGTYKLRWTVSNPGGCEEFEEITLTVYQRATGGSVTCLESPTAKLVCSGSDITLRASGYIQKIIRWEVSTDAINWTPIDNTSDILAYPNIQQTTYFRVQVGGKGYDQGCTNLVASGVLQVKVDLPSIGGTISTAGPTVYCIESSSPGILILKDYRGTSIQWEKSEDNGGSWSLISGASGNSYGYSALLTTTQFRALVKNGECSAEYSDPITITIDPKPTTANAGPDEKLCLNSGLTYQLNGNLPAIGTGIWTQPPGQTAVIDNPGLNNTTVSNLEKGKRYTFLWTINNGTCAGSTSTMNLDVLADIVNSIKSTRLVSCPGEAVTLSTDQLSGGDVPSYVSASYSYSWESSPDKISWTVIPGANQENLTVNPVVTTYYRRTVKSYNSCDVTSEAVEIFINAITPSADAGGDVIICGETSYKLNGNDPGAGFTGTWKEQSGNSLTFTPDTHSPDAVVGNLLPGQTYQLEWRVGGLSPCPDNTSLKSIVVRKPVTTAAVGATVRICLQEDGSNNHVTLSGNAPDAANGETGLWTQTSGVPAHITDPSLFNTEVTGLLPGSYVFEWGIKNDATVGDAGCRESKATLTIEVTAYPVKGLISNGNITVCKGNDPGSLDLTGYSSSDLLQWQSSTDSITFNDIAGANAPSFAPGNMAQTKWYRVRISQASGCLNSIYTDNIKIRVDEPSEGGITTGSVARVCTGVNSVTVSLSGEKGDVVRWEQSGDNFNTWIPVLSTSKSGVFHNLNADTWFRAIVRNGACSEVPSAVTYVQVLPNVTTAIAGDDQYLCNEASATLDGNIAVKGTGSWTKISGPSCLIEDPADPHSKISGLTAGTYIFKWSIENGICDASTDTITIYNYPALTNAITGSVTTCSGQTVHITGGLPTGGNGAYAYQWQWSSDNINWTDLPGEVNRELTSVFTASTWLRRVVKSGPCSLESNTVYIAVQPPLGNNSISSDQVLCAGMPSVQLAGSLPTGGDGIFFYQWQKSLDGTSWSDIAGAVAAVFDPGTLAETTRFRRIVTTSLCNGDQKSISNEVGITVNPLAKAEFTAVRLKSCIPFDLKQVITLIPHDDRVATYQWYVNGVSVGSGKDFPGYILYNDGESATVKLVTDSKFGCGSDSMELTFETVKDVTASFTKDKVVGCGPLSVSFNNTSAPLSRGTYIWDFGNGITSTDIHPAAITFEPNPNHRDTTYVITLKASTGCKETIFTDSVLVHPLPYALFSPNKTWGCSPFEVTFNNQSKAGSNSKYTFDFGDGQTLVKNDVSDVTHTFYTTKTDTVTVRLKVENECGVDSNSYKIVVYPNTVTPQLIIDGDRKFGCAPLTVRFDNHSEGANSFYWDLKDGNTFTTKSAPESITHTFTVPGTYEVSLLATNGCSSATDTEIITVYAQPNANFRFNNGQYCVKDSVQFFSTPETSASYHWDFDDGTTANTANPRHAFARAGKYNVKLTVQQSHPDGSVCSSFTTQEIEILPLPVALFTSNATSLNCAPFKLTVSATPANAAYVEWNFGDPNGNDNILTGHVAEHTFQLPGLYRVKQVAYNASGCMDTIVKTVKITERPTANFSAADTMFCGMSATVSFANQSTYSGTDAVVYKWLVNNRPVSSQKNFSYPFAVPSDAVMPYKFDVKLIAVSTLGCPDTVTHTIQFNPLPKADFDLKTNIACTPFKVEIENKSRYTDEYLWYLDGHLISMEQSPSDIVLTGVGRSYKLKLKTLNSYGCKADSIEKTINTYGRPKAFFTLSDSVSCNGKLEVAITNSSNGAVKYVWDFGDNSPLSNDAAPQHLYGEPGIYKLRLIALNSFCSDTLTRMIRISGKPLSAFVPDVNRGCTLINVAFRNISENALTYIWDFGDGTYSSSKNPAHTFSYLKSPYVVKLVVKGEYGCADTAITTINVSAPPVADFTVLPDSVIKVPEYTFSFKNRSEGTGLKYQWFFGDTKVSTEENPVHTYINNGSHTVRLIVTNAEGCADTLVKIVRIDGVPGTLYVPSGFEPGSLNPSIKTFIPKGSGIAKYSLKIFNKWGRLVWQSDKLTEDGSPAEGWDGTIDGAPASQGVYIWDIKASFLDGSEWKGMKYERGSKNTVGPINLIR